MRWDPIDLLKEFKEIRTRKVQRMREVLCTDLRAIILLDICDCTEDGLQVRTCSICGYEEKIILEALGHDFDEGVVTPPTTTEQGYTTYTCKRDCGYSYKDNFTSVLPDENAPQIVVSSVKSMVGQTAKVDLSLKNNPGITALAIRLSYDESALTLLESQSTGLLYDMTPTFSQSINDIPYQMQWTSGTYNNNVDGVFATLTFLVKDSTSIGEYPINLEYEEDDIFNTRFDNVHFDVLQGGIKVINYIPGDVNGNGVVNLKDVALLQQFLCEWDVVIIEAASDPNGDGKISLKDVALLQQYLCGWDVVLK